ncbi:transcription-repair coupling factor [candidate division GN15 bacterium]|uniref:Transcription-repair-coupling factor n=1 Tax=candidate division GN15 bacterium TaxID=2072418 RepID=A0A855X2W7_9BACT|nr:MAG: transcription-repair coupling factor [candidate division GN15 bacterium]
MVRLRGGRPASIAVTGLSGSSESFLLNALGSAQTSPILVVTRHSDDAADLYEDLLNLMAEDALGYFPSRQILPYDFRAPVGEIMGQRLSTLSGLLGGTKSIVVCSIRALMEPTIPVGALQESRVDIQVDREIDLDDLTDRLIRLGFRRVPLVEEVGDFARRGGLIDLFTPGYENPIRVELFGDEVESIRVFEVGTQRTVGQLQHVGVLPKREIPITQETLERELERLPETDADYIRHRYLNDPELPGLEWLSLLFGLEKGSLLDYLPADSIVLFENEDALKAETESIIHEADMLRDRLANRLTRLPAPDEYYASPDNLFASLRTHAHINLLPFRGARNDIISFHCNPHPAFASRLDLLGNTLQEFRDTGMFYFIATDTDGQAARIDELIRQKARLEQSPHIEVADIRGGFVCSEGRFAILTDHEIFSRYHRRVRKKKFREGVAIADYSTLNRGDYVVHTDFGIARYLGLKTLVVDGRNRDCLLLQYAGTDKLYVPIEEFNRVSKYSGKDSAPQLTALGGPGWDKLKEKTKKAIADMAADLIKLYAARKSKPGTSFGEDSVWLKQLEAAFPYEETPDQQRAIDDVKRDMTDERPMDRLVCGDVGYGKTEVAIRAAFKAMDAGKQVAVLVPTTILAQQHYSTFSERLRDYPFKIAMLSRFRTRKEQLETAQAVGKGALDMVIGTHRLLSADVKFHDLGLLIIDEEHRFGVKHKEKLRQLAATVDTLAMTATPIPRTLQMSLMGARDMSLINTSPKDRLPILSEIAEFDPAIISTAILREIERGGQVFFVHNRVQTIESMHNYLRKLLPKVEIAVAHGQMHERSLEGIMLAFLAKRYDVLLCTSIIESGLDIQNANTIIINRADRFGLAQLYQIRGRVGRSARRAYAYLLTPPTRLLNADAIKRLRALEAHSDLGSGFALAMRDLEIRGAGTILGPKQSGFIEEIGFDLYNRLLEEAVAELKGEEIQRLPETKLELDIETYLADGYVNDRQHKVDIYRRLADSRNLDDVERIRDEVTDRFGRMPQSAANLIEATAVKIAASLLEIEKVRMHGGIAHLFFREDRKLTRSEVEALRKGTDCPMEFSLIGIPRITIDLTSVSAIDRLSHLRGLLGKVG